MLELEKEALALIVWRVRFGRGNGPVIRRIEERKKERKKE